MSVKQISPPLETVPVATGSDSVSEKSAGFSLTTDVDMTQLEGNSSPTTGSGSPETRSGNFTIPNVPKFTILQPKNSSPLLTNPASAPTIPIQPPTPTQKKTTTSTSYVTHSIAQPTPGMTSPFTKDSLSTQTPSVPLSWAQRARKVDDRSLERLAPLEYSPEGKPRVLVPDEVFQRGAQAHREYIVGSFLGKMPAYGPIQSVLNYLWGKGQKLEIHLNPLKRSMLVRIPNDYIRNKVLEKKLWYVETSMFYVTQWNAEMTTSTPEIETIPLWAHLRGIPFDLRTREGLSLAAGLVGEPKGTDEFTLNLTNLEWSHVFVEVDLKKPLPDSVELVRQNGEVIPIDVEYPWRPPSCSHCNEIGHILKNCINRPFTTTPTPKAAADNASSSTPSPKAASQAVPAPLMAEKKMTTDQNRAVDLVEESPITALSNSPVSDVVVKNQYSHLQGNGNVTKGKSDVSIVEIAIPDKRKNSLPRLSQKTKVRHFRLSSQKNPTHKKPSHPSISSEEPLIPPEINHPPITFSSNPAESTIIIGLPSTLPPSFGSYIVSHQSKLSKSSSLPSSFTLPTSNPHIENAPSLNPNHQNTPNQTSLLSECSSLSSGHITQSNPSTLDEGLLLQGVSPQR